MESSLCSSFVPSSSVAPGGAWMPLPLSPAALPSGGPAALLAGQTKRLNSVMWCVRRLMKFTVTWSFSGYILAVLILHVTGLCSSAHQHWSYLEVCGLPFQPLVAETAGFLAIHFEQIPALYKRWKGLHFKSLPKKKKKKSTIYIHINHIEESHKLFKEDKRHSGTEKFVFFSSSQHKFRNFSTVSEAFSDVMGC